MENSGLRPWKLKGRELLPIVQGGMGVAVSAGGLAGAVAACGALGTLSAVDLRRLHPDLMDATASLEGAQARTRINEANLVALDREIRKARRLSNGRGAIAVNVMRAVSEYESYVRRRCEAKSMRSSSAPVCRSTCPTSRRTIRRSP